MRWAAMHDILRLVIEAALEQILRYRLGGC